MCKEINHNYTYNKNYFLGKLQENTNSFFYFCKFKNLSKFILKTEILNFASCFCLLLKHQTCTCIHFLYPSTSETHGLSRKSLFCQQRKSFWKSTVHAFPNLIKIYFWFLLQKGERRISFFAELYRLLNHMDNGFEKHMGIQVY